MKKLLILAALFAFCSVVRASGPVADDNIRQSVDYGSATLHELKAPIDFGGFAAVEPVDTDTRQSSQRLILKIFKATTQDGTVYFFIEVRGRPNQRFDIETSSQLVNSIWISVPKDLPFETNSEGVTQFQAELLLDSPTQFFRAFEL